MHEGGKESSETINEQVTEDDSESSLLTKYNSSDLLPLGIQNDIYNYLQGSFVVCITQSCREPTDREDRGALGMNTFFTVPVDPVHAATITSGSSRMCAACCRLGRYDRLSTVRCHLHTYSPQQASPRILHSPEEAANLHSRPTSNEFSNFISSPHKKDTKVSLEQTVNTTMPNLTEKSKGLQHYRFSPPNEATTGPSNQVLSYDKLNSTNKATWRGSIDHLSNIAPVTSVSDYVNKQQVSLLEQRMKASPTISKRPVKIALKPSDIPNNLKCTCANLHQRSEDIPWSLDSPLGEPSFNAQSMQNTPSEEMYTLLGHNKECTLFHNNIESCNTDSVKRRDSIGKIINTISKSQITSSSSIYELEENMRNKTSLIEDETILHSRVSAARKTLIPSDEAELLNLRLRISNRLEKFKSYRDFKYSTQNSSVPTSRYPSTKSSTFNHNLIALDEILENSPHTSYFKTDNQARNILEPSVSLTTEKENQHENSPILHNSTDGNNNIPKFSVIFDIGKVLETANFSQRHRPILNVSPLDSVNSITSQNSLEMSAKTYRMSDEKISTNISSSLKHSLIYEMHTLSPVSEVNAEFSEYLHSSLSATSNALWTNQSIQGVLLFENSEKLLSKLTYNKAHSLTIRATQTENNYFDTHTLQYPAESVKHGTVKEHMHKLLNAEDTTYHISILFYRWDMVYLAETIQLFNISAVSIFHDFSCILQFVEESYVSFIPETQQVIKQENTLSSQAVITQNISTTYVLFKAIEKMCVVEKHPLFESADLQISCKFSYIAQFEKVSLESPEKATILLPIKSLQQYHLQSASFERKHTKPHSYVKLENLNKIFTLELNQQLKYSNNYTSHYTAQITEVGKEHFVGSGTESLQQSVRHIEYKTHDENSATGIDGVMLSQIDVTFGNLEQLSILHTYEILECRNVYTLHALSHITESGKEYFHISILELLGSAPVDTFSEPENTPLLYSGITVKTLDKLFVLETYQPILFTNTCTPHQIYKMTQAGELSQHPIKPEDDESSKTFLLSECLEDRYVAKSRIHIYSCPVPQAVGHLYEETVLELSITEFPVYKRTAFTEARTMFAHEAIMSSPTSILHEFVNKMSFLLETYQPLVFTNTCTPHAISKMTQAGELSQQPIKPKDDASFKTFLLSECSEERYVAKSHMHTYSCPVPQAVGHLYEEAVLELSTTEFFVYKRTAFTQASTMFAHEAIMLLPTGILHEAVDEMYLEKIHLPLKSEIIFTSYVVPQNVRIGRKLPEDSKNSVEPLIVASTKTQVLLEPLERRVSPEISRSEQSSIANGSPLVETESFEHENEIRTVRFESPVRQSPSTSVQEEEHHHGTEQVPETRRIRRSPRRGAGPQAMAPRRRVAQNQSGFNMLFSPVKATKSGRRAHSTHPENDVPTVLETAIQRLRRSAR